LVVDHHYGTLNAEGAVDRLVLEQRKQRNGDLAEEVPFENQLEAIDVVGLLSERPDLVVERDDQLVAGVDDIRWVERFTGI
jgi:hypothetical protein